MLIKKIIDIRVTFNGSKISDIKSFVSSITPDESDARTSNVTEC